MKLSVSLGLIFKRFLRIQLCQYISIQYGNMAIWQNAISVYSNNQKRLAKQNVQIEALEDSIGRINDRVDVLQATLDILRIIDSTKVEEAEQLLWNIKEE